TDGLTEFRNYEGHEYGERRLRRLLVSLAALEPDDILARILADLGEFSASAPQEDDVTIVVAKIRD
ncbi:MAG: SpoIIE family protein phosphatase, partial [Myxococcota bacterium]|nr:SpoIIE family protein phosphatase [Myxococcota bacterium]